MGAKLFVHRLFSRMGLLRQVVALKSACISSPLIHSIAFRNEFSFYKQLLVDSPLVFDIGGNVGNYARVFRRLGCRVITAEPIPECAARIRRRFAGDDGLILLETAVSDRPGQTVFHINEEIPELSTLSRDWMQNSRYATTSHWSKSIPVPVTTLSEMIRQYGRPGYCKIDVEGHEADVLDGLEAPIPLVSFEFCIEFPEQILRCLDRLEALAAGDGQRVGYNYSPGQRMRLTLPEWTDRAGLLDALDLRKNGGLAGDIFARTGE
ncbi:MAG: FkbM family methyltransferase [Verrucomicrobiae bacterium]|nr:FkbM family methyltransferase [Verrucomicrobiae bacterium]